MPARKPIGLAALIDPMSTSDFMESYWRPARWTVFRGPLSRLRLISDLPELRTLDGLLRAPHKRLRCWFPDRGGSHGQIRATPTQARQMYNGTVNTVVIDTIQHPAIVAWMDAIARDLGTAQPSIGCNVYLSPPGAGSRFHFDSQDNFLLQVAGKKEWLVGEASIPYTTRSFFGDKVVSKELRSMAGDRLPLLPPEHPKKVVLSPGDVLFLPKGTWHASHTKEDSIGYTLTFPSLNWADLFHRRLRSELIRELAFRETATGFRGTKGRRAVALEECARLHEKMMEIVDAWTPEDIVPDAPVHAKPRQHARARRRTSATASKAPRRLVPGGVRDG